MAKILVPFTLTGGSHAALAMALNFAGECDSTLFLLHVVRHDGVKPEPTKSKKTIG